MLGRAAVISAMLSINVFDNRNEGRAIIFCGILFPFFKQRKRLSRVERTFGKACVDNIFLI